MRTAANHEDNHSAIDIKVRHYPRTKRKADRRGYRDEDDDCCECDRTTCAIILCWMFACIIIGYTIFAVLLSDSYEINNEDKEFRAWLVKFGVNPTRVVVPTDKRALIVSTNIGPGTRIFEIPNRAFLNSARVRDANHSPVGVFLKRHEDINIQDDEVLALALIHEKILAKDSVWYPYIARLPTVADFADLPMFYSYDELAYAEGTIVPVLRGQLDKLNHLTEISRSVCGKEEFKKWGCDQIMQDVQWALAVVWTRYWNIPKLGGNSLIPLEDMAESSPDGETLVYDEARGVAYIQTTRDYVPGNSIKQKYYDSSAVSSAVLVATYGHADPEHDVLEIFFEIPPQSTLFNSSTRAVINDTTNATAAAREVERFKSKTYNAAKCANLRVLITPMLATPPADLVECYAVATITKIDNLPRMESNKYSNEHLTRIRAAILSYLEGRIIPLYPSTAAQNQDLIHSGKLSPQAKVLVDLRTRELSLLSEFVQIVTRYRVSTNTKV